MLNVLHLKRFEYALELENHNDEGDSSSTDDPLPGRVREVCWEDTAELASIMQSSFHKTIDDETDTFEEALAVIESFFRDPVEPPLLSHSWVYEEDGHLVGACLTCFWTLRGSPLVAYIFIDPADKGRGIASVLLDRCLDGLKVGGYEDVRSVVTSGNTPSEKLFLKAGFHVVAQVQSLPLAA